MEASIAKLDSEYGEQDLPELEKEIAELEKECKLAEDEVDRVSNFELFFTECVTDLDQWSDLIMFNLMSLKCTPLFEAAESKIDSSLNYLSYVQPSYAYRDPWNALFCGIILVSCFCSWLRNHLTGR